MTLDEFIKKFAEQFDETDMSEFKADTIYRNLDEWSSMHALLIISMIDDEMGKTLKAQDFKSANTIEDLYKLAQTK